MEALLVIRANVPLSEDHRAYIVAEVEAQMARSQGVLVLPSHLGVHWLRPGDKLEPPLYDVHAIEHSYRHRFSADSVHEERKGFFASLFSTARSKRERG